MIFSGSIERNRSTAERIQPHGARIPRTTLRYAIERVEEKKRKRILAQTKPEGKNRR
jgi:hypothetical protein